METEHKIVIVGGGFGGVACALRLLKENLPDTKIVLLTNNPHFEYHAALYRVVTGRSPLEVCIPLRDIFGKRDIEIIIDTATSVNTTKKEIKGASGSTYNYDSLVLALGSETMYFDIPGLKKYSFGFKSINEAIELKEHLHSLFEEAKTLPKEEAMTNLHIVIVGGGASGVELAGELAGYGKKLCKKHGVDPSLLTIDLVEASPRLLPALPPDISEKALKALHKLGVNVFLNRTVVKEDDDEIFMKDMKMKTKTVIWTAGIKANSLFGKIKSFSLDKRGRVNVTDYLEAEGHKNIYVIGDSASTTYTGMAQTAVVDGRHVAKVIAAKQKGWLPKKYRPQKPAYAIPVGPRKAVTLVGDKRFYGLVGWIIRRAADFRFFLSVLPITKAITAFRGGTQLCESCPVCTPEKKSN